MQKQTTSHIFDFEFESFFYGSHLAMGILSLDLTFIAVNKEGERIVGYAEEELLGKSMTTIIEVGEMTIDFQNMQKLLDGEIGSYTISRNYLKKDGKTVSGANTVSLIDQGGERYILGIFHKKFQQDDEESFVSQNVDTLSKILAINPDIHYIMDIENRTYIYQNVNILKYFGYDKKDIGDCNEIEFLISKIDSDTILEVAQANKVFKHNRQIGEFVEVEYRFLSKNEGWKWLKAKSTPLVNSSPGKVKLSYGIIQDITHSKEIEEKLLAQEAFINQIANVVPDVIAVYNLWSLKPVYSNLRNRTLLGYTQDEWVNPNIVKPRKDFVQLMKNRVEDVKNLTENEVLSDEVVYYDKEGKERWILLKYKAFSRREDGLVNEILVVVSDIDDYKRTLDKLEIATRTNEAIIDALPDLLLVVNKEGVYTKVFSGVDLKIENSSAIIGKHLDDVMNKEVVPEMFEIIQNCLKTGKTAYHNFKHVYSNGRPLAYFSNYFSKLNDEEVLIIARDQTQKRIAQNSLDDKVLLLSVQNKQLEKFIAKNSELERFAYIIAHDLKEPLRSISAISELIELEVEKSGNENLRKLLRHLSQNSLRMTALIEGVLDYSKIDNERIVENIDLNNLLKTITFDLNLVIKERKVQLKITNFNPIKGDETQIRQLFQNLISNAIKFNNSEQPMVELGTIAKDGALVYFVKDNGIGIQSEFKEPIFMMFKRINKYEDYPGQGIGLSMCKKIIESHGGKIWIEDNEEGGTCFYFTLA